MKKIIFQVLDAYFNKCDCAGGRAAARDPFMSRQTCHADATITGSCFITNATHYFWQGVAMEISQEMFRVKESRQI